jgi:hypothetical protein
MAGWYPGCPRRRSTERVGPLRAVAERARISLGFMPLATSLRLNSATAAASAAFSSGARTSPRDRGLRGTHSQAHADGCKKKLMGSVYNFVQ